MTESNQAVNTLQAASPVGWRQRLGLSGASTESDKAPTAQEASKIHFAPITRRRQPRKRAPFSDLDIGEMEEVDLTSGVDNADNADNAPDVVTGDERFEDDDEDYEVPSDDMAPLDDPGLDEAKAMAGWDIVFENRTCLEYSWQEVPSQTQWPKRRLVGVARDYFEDMASEVASGVASGVKSAVNSRVASRVTSGVASGVKSATSLGVTSSVASGVKSAMSSDVTAAVVHAAKSVDTARVAGWVQGAASRGKALSTKLTSGK